MAIVYFIQAGEHGPVKIGRTSYEPASRLSSLQTGNAIKLTIIGTCDESEEYSEKDLHRLLSMDRIRGEWFFATDQLYDYVRMLCDDCALPPIDAPGGFVPWSPR